MELRPNQKSKRTFAVHVVLFSVFLATAFFLRVASHNLPPAWIESMSRAISTEKFAVEMENVSISLRRGELDVRHLRVFPRGTVQDAVLELDNTSIKLRPVRGHHPLTWLRSVRIGQLTIPSTALGMNYGFESEGNSHRYLGANGLPLFIPEFGPVKFSCGTANVFGSTGRSIEATLIGKDDTLILNDIRVNMTDRREDRQIVTGHLEFGLATFTLLGDGNGTLDPEKLLPIFTALNLPKLSSEIMRFRFPESPPDIAIDIDYQPCENLRDLTVKVKSGYCLYNDTPVTFLTGTIKASGSNEWDVVDIGPLHGVRPEGVINGSLRIDTTHAKLSFDADSTLDPLHLLRIIRITQGTPSLPMTFDNPTRVVASGIYDFSTNAMLTDISGIVNSPCISTSKVKFEKATARCHLTDSSWSVNKATAEVLGGQYEGQCVFTPPSSSHHRVIQLDSQGKFSGLRQNEWSKFYGTQSPDASGLLDLTYAIRGSVLTNSAEFLSGLSGTIDVDIRKAHLYRIPLFAGLTEVIASTIPGVDFILAQDNLKSSLAFTNRVFNVKSLSIEGNVFSASGYGTLQFDGDVNLRIKAHLLNRETWVGQGLYYVLFPISKILEFQALGPISKPKWSSATLSQIENTEVRK